MLMSGDLYPMQEEKKQERSETNEIQDIIRRLTLLELKQANLEHKFLCYYTDLELEKRIKRLEVNEKLI